MGQDPQGDPDGRVLVGAFTETGESEDSGAGSNSPRSLLHAHYPEPHSSVDRRQGSLRKTQTLAYESPVAALTNDG